MIVFPGSDDDINYIHLIIGPESDMTFDCAGFYMYEIEDVLRGMDTNKPCRIIVTRSNSETDTLISLQQTGANHPLTLLKRALASLNIKQTKSESPSKDVSEVRGDYTYIPFGKCPKCNSEGGLYLKKNTIPVCEDCLSIDKGLKKKITRGKHSKEDTNHNATE